MQQDAFGGSCGSSLEKVPNFVLPAPVSDRHLNLHQHLKNFDDLVNEAANFKVPESSKTNRMLTRLMGCVCAGGGEK